jgi:transcriptional regulator with XRE-family HTH domain
LDKCVKYSGYMDINAHIAQRVLGLRRQLGDSLETLAERSGVSRSMISLIERGQTSPTAVILDKLAAALGVTLAGLFAEASEAGTPAPLVRKAEQPLWQDPASGYVRRNVSPPGFPSSIELVEVTFPAGQSVSFDTISRQPDTHEQIWVLEGSIEITAGEKNWLLSEGDCLALTLERHIVFRNPGSQQARYLVVLNAQPGKTF